MYPAREILRKEAVTLFIDGLPMEMTWDWLLQIFKGEGEIIDVYVSQKRRRNNDCQFGFVRFKKLDEARKAIKNLNGVKIREKSLKVSFAKYDKEGRPWNGVVLQEAEKVADATVEKEDKYRKVTNVGRSYKEVVESRPQNLKLDGWRLKNPRILTGSESHLNRMKNDRMNLKGMIWEVVEEFFSSDNMEGIKQKLGILIEEALRVINKDEGTVTKLIGCRNEDEEQRSDGEEKQAGVFLEEELVHSMLHKDQSLTNSPIGYFESDLTLEGSSQYDPEVGPMGKSANEANHLHGPVTQAHSPVAAPARTNDLGFEEQTCSSPDCPPGYEDFMGGIGLSDVAKMQNGSNEKSDCAKVLEERNEDDQSCGESHGSFSNSIDKVPQTPLLDSVSFLNRDNNEEVMPDGEDLVEARITWDVGKFLGLKVSNEEAMIDALSKVDECQDFVLPRKRGRPKKNKSRN